MRVSLRSDQDQLVIYREKIGTALFASLMMSACIVLGILFIYFAMAQKEATAFSIFGAIFLILGLLGATGLPKFLARLKKDDGAILLVANKAGLSVTPLLNMKTMSYEWNTITQIYLTKKLVTVDIDEKALSWNQMIIYLRAGAFRKKISLTERGKAQLSVAPKGENVFYIGFPKGRMAFVRDELIRFCPNDCEIGIYEKIYFNYKTKTEEFQKAVEAI
ncbi:MAG TPA: hypothetical protein PLS42_14430 [Candidatus Competibacter denitrificans]|nr:hypothetical protein [Candidatus Competibacter denitrificans]